MAYLKRFFDREVQIMHGTFLYNCIAEVFTSGNETFIMSTMDMQRWVHESDDRSGASGATRMLRRMAATANSNETDQAQTALVSVIVFFVLSVIVLCGVVYMNWYVFHVCTDSPFLAEACKTLLNLYYSPV
jgi:hypothetical protein